MSGNVGLMFLILWPVLGGIVGFFMGKKKTSNAEDTADIVTLAELVVACYFAYQVLIQGKEITFTFQYFAGLGLSFTLDGFRTLYALLTAAAFCLAQYYSKEYMKGEAHCNRYRMFFQFTLAATMGVFLSNNVYNLFLFFEILSFASFPLVIQEETDEAKQAALSYLTIAIIGGLLILAGMTLVYAMTGSFQYDSVYEMMAEYDGQATILWVGGLLMLLGFGAKASLFPLHTWLPKAHPVAPAPASAILSAILTKTGVVGMIYVVCDLMFPSESFGILVLVLGTITMVLGGILALLSNDIKRTLACSSMSQLGFVTVGLSMCALLGEENALAAGGTVLHMINHTLFKLTLFFLAGIVVKQMHTGDFNSIQGFGKKKPLFHAAYLLSALGISGVPLLNGYVSKTLIHEALVEYGNTPCEWLFLISGGLTFAYMLKIYIILFWEKGANEPEKLRLPLSTWIPVLLPVVCCLVMGLAPNLVMDKLADAARGFFHGSEVESAMQYFSLTNLKGAAISIGIGLVLYVVVVRCFLRKKSETGVSYRPGLPAWMDLEQMIYRPLLLKVLPCIGTFISRILDWFVDGSVLLLRRSVYRDNNTEEKPVYGGKICDGLGECMNLFKRGINVTVRKKNPIETNYVVALADYKRRFILFWSVLSKSVSFGLLMFALGFVLTIAYLICLM